MSKSKHKPMNRTISLCIENKTLKHELKKLKLEHKLLKNRYYERWLKIKKYRLINRKLLRKLKKIKNYEK